MILTRLKSRYKLRGGNVAMERIDEILAALSSRSIERVIQEGLHEYLDWLQLRLCDVTSELSRSFFGQPLPGGYQNQGQ